MKNVYPQKAFKKSGRCEQPLKNPKKLLIYFLTEDIPDPDKKTKKGIEEFNIVTGKELPIFKKYDLCSP